MSPKEYAEWLLKCNWIWSFWIKSIEDVLEKLSECNVPENAISEKLSITKSDYGSYGFLSEDKKVMYTRSWIINQKSYEKN